VKLFHSIAFRFSAASGAALAATLLTTIGAVNVRRQAVDGFAQSSQARIVQADESLDSNFREVEQNLTYLT
jgi:methyl-accepting chemotaxis protein